MLMSAQCLVLLLDTGFLYGVALICKPDLLLGEWAWEFPED